MDITDPAAVSAGVDGVIADFGTLDAVINNAGAGHVGTIEQESVEDVRAVMEVNFFGTVLVTKAALPHLRASGGRVVTVTSVGGIVGQPFNEAYCAAKFAVEGFMESLAPVAATVGVTVVVVEPGAVASEFRQQHRRRPGGSRRCRRPLRPGPDRLPGSNRGRVRQRAERDGRGGGRP